MRLINFTWRQLVLVCLIILVACKAGPKGSFEKLRATQWKKHHKEEKRRKRMVEKSYKIHLKNQSKPMRKAMKKDNRRMRRDKRRKARRYS
jgi:hypothetical protein